VGEALPNGGARGHARERILDAAYERLATEAGVAKADDFARRWHILMRGSIIAACEGDLEAARRARSVGAVLLANELEGATDGRRPA
jgi:hypothetical protein